MSEAATNDDVITAQDLGVSDNADTQKDVQATDDAQQDDSPTDTEQSFEDDPNKDKELVFGKYEDLASAEEAFKTLESENGRLRREKRPEAPEEYSIDFSGVEDFADYKDHVTAEALKDNEYLQAILPSAKKHNITQEALNDIITDYLKVDIGTITNAKDEFKALGDDGPKMLKEVQAFIAKFPEEEQGRFAALGLHKDGILGTFKKDNLAFAHKMMSMTGDIDPPEKDPSSSGHSAADYKAQAFKLKSETPNFESNTAAIEKYEALMDKAIEAEARKK